MWCLDTLIKTPFDPALRYLASLQILLRCVAVLVYLCQDNAKRYESHHGAMMKKRLKHLSFDYMDNDGNDKRHYFYKNVAVPAGEMTVCLIL